MLHSKERDKQLDRYLAQTFRHGHKTKNNRQLLLNVRFSLLRLEQQFLRAVNVPLVRPSVSQTVSQSQSINQSIIYLIPGLQVWFGKRKVRFGLGILLD